MKDKLFTWLLHCLNPNCSAHIEWTGSEPDVICSRCGGKLEVIEKIERHEETK